MAHTSMEAGKLMVAAMAGFLLAGCNSDSSSDTSDGGAPIDRDFGQPTSSQIRPGVEISATGYGVCTSNFIFAADEVTYYIGVAAHCFSNDTNQQPPVDPCVARNAPLGFSDIRIENASQPGELAYSSWAAMNENGETPGSDICTYNDFALVKIHPDDIANVHPAAITYGGPTALFTGSAQVGDAVYSYGRSSFHSGVQDLEAKEGQVSGIQAEGLNYRLSFDNPGLPGDSGSAVLHSDGRALAVLTTVGVAVGVSNGAVSLERALNYGKNSGHIRSSTRLMTWSVFTP
ncbi:hypothetical protein FHR99_002064 [Litorivivens lipolytica]|uniref:Serine protease n=1 Tax=Litorivivens lipolytica TaxID=1524264 RepID=A0A7W4W5F1_9GAMM|nr:trypsin-like peptidase domain-containing protein [Litorivivens lipolytica]MBB3047798.1 hypothetical protein [Litorivivens lipolytica]